MRRVLMGIAVAGAAFGGATAVMAKTEREQGPGHMVPGLKPHTAFDRGDHDDHGDSRDGPRFEISLSGRASGTSLDGRVYVIVSLDASSEPRDQISVPDGTPFWGLDVDGLRPGRSVELSGDIAACSAIRFARWTTCHRATTAYRRS
ncbi:hypothetical protein [Candidatus Solirubrobacter pratensis]|uniref:hypothetical protein n=1 Tax=Candidatus Solirubrobacter pratensis TaxID=1298857 RepID=UPI0012DDD600|nr:hypothetical protein [Candidatus Solirubrobacter pratensis]